MSSELVLLRFQTQSPCTITSVWAEIRLENKTFSFVKRPLQTKIAQHNFLFAMGNTRPVDKHTCNQIHYSIFENVVTDLPLFDGKTCRDKYLYIWKDKNKLFFKIQN